MKKRILYVIIPCFIFIILLLWMHNKKGDYYNMKEIEEPITTIVLVNKEYYLKKDYVPSSLEAISTEYAHDEKYLESTAKTAFEKLSRDAKKLGYRIVAVSAYRNYDYQEKLYEQYVKEKGKAYADKCSARPGHSEHQTGLSLDVEGSNYDYNLFMESKEFDWMKENAHKYGFILRYPKGKENITKFKYEPWHYRYVGLEVAKIIYEQDLTLEEYHKHYQQ